MNKITEKMFYSHLEEPLEEELKNDKEYQKCCSDYDEVTSDLEKKLGTDEESRKLLMRLDEAVGAYSARYHEILYHLAFHDGMEVGLEHSRALNGKVRKEQAGSFTLEDMVHLIYIFDAYNELNHMITGGNLISHYDDGLLGKFSRVFGIINPHIVAELRDGDDPAGYEILNDTEKSPVMRAKILMGE